MTDDEKLTRFAVKISVAFLTALLLLVMLGMWGCPQYQVWEQGQVGQGELLRATSSRKIAIQEAEAKLESAKLLALAEAERAKGVAAANQIIGDSLKQNEAYLRYLWIQHLDTNPNNVIYVPTENALPIFLEAGRGTHEPKKEAK